MYENKGVTQFLSLSKNKNLNKKLKNRTTNISVILSLKVE